MLHIGMATLPARINEARLVLAALQAQSYTDFHLYAVLNGHSSVPAIWPRDDRFTFMLADNSEGDLAKFRAVKEPGSHLLATIDDDLNYPPDYLATLIHWHNQFRGVAAVSVHGSILDKPFTKWIKGRRVFHLSAELKQPQQVNITATGTALLAKSWLEKLELKPWRNKGDIGVSIGLRQQEVPRVVIPRKKDWLTEMDSEPVCYTEANYRDVVALIRPHVHGFHHECPAPGRALPAIPR